MAKFGEGDERWIVKDLGDQGTNVNNWHWKEFDALEWCQKEISAQFSDACLVEAPGLSLKITGASTKGEAIINNRKNKVRRVEGMHCLLEGLLKGQEVAARRPKCFMVVYRAGCSSSPVYSLSLHLYGPASQLIPAYELDITLNWTATLTDGSGAPVATPQGRIQIPYVSDENHDELPEIRFSGEADDTATQRVREAFLKSGKEAVVSKVNGFVSQLRAGGPMRPGSKDAAAAGDAAASAAASKAKLSSAKAEEVKPANGSSKKVAAKSLTLTEKYYARPNDIYTCFVVDGKVRAFTQSNATIDPRPGGSFSWFSGSVVGEFVELEEDKKIVMNWRFSSWKPDCFSRVVITLESPEVGTTILKMHQTGIPEEDAFGQAVIENTEKGWKGQIFTRIRQVFGYGV